MYLGKSLNIGVILSLILFYFLIKTYNNVFVNEMCNLDAN